MDASATTAKLDPAANGSTVTIDPWAMEVPSPGAGDYVVCAPGNYPATIIGVVDIGHQLDKFNKDRDGATSEVRQLVLFFELAERQPDGKRFLLERLYTWSLHEKSSFSKLASSVLSRTFKEGDRFSPKELLGVAVMVAVSNAMSAEKTYHKVESVAAFPKGMQAPRPENALFSYSVVEGGEFHPPVELPYVYGQPIKDLIAASREARARTASDSPF